MVRIRPVLVALVGAGLTLVAGAGGPSTRPQVSPEPAAGRTAPWDPESIRALLASDGRRAVEVLNGGALEAFVSEGQYDVAEELTNAGSAAAARDTWPVEQLQRRRVEALSRAGRHKEALAAAKGLFLVAGLGSVPHDLDLLADCLAKAHPEQPGIAVRFKLQQLAAAQEDPAARKRALAGLGPGLLADVAIDPRPFEKAVEARRGRADFDGLYGLGNLLLLSGRVTEARAAFERAYAVAPAGERRYASEGLAKVIKAEDASVGRANAFVQALRPRR